MAENWENLLSAEDKEFIVEKAANGYNPEEILYLMEQELDREMTPKRKTISNYLKSEKGNRDLKTRKNVRQKKAAIEKENLVETLVDLHEELKMWQKELRDEEYGMTANEAIKNLLKTIEKIGELKGELQRQGTTNNVIKIDQSQNYMQKNFTKVVKHLNEDQKKDVVEQLKDDEDITDFVIKRKSESKGE